MRFASHFPLSVYIIDVTIYVTVNHINVFITQGAYLCHATYCQVRDHSMVYLMKYQNDEVWLRNNSAILTYHSLRESHLIVRHSDHCSENKQNLLREGKTTLKK